MYVVQLHNYDVLQLFVIVDDELKQVFLKDLIHNNVFDKVFMMKYWKIYLFKIEN